MVNGYQNPQYEYKYCTGGKTGYTNIAHSTLVTFAEKNGMQLLSVIMYADSPKQGEPNEYTDTTSLLNFGFANYKKYSVNEEKTDINVNLFNTYNNFFNVESSPIRLSNESAVVLPKGAKLSNVKQKVTYNKKANIQDGENIIGKVTYIYGDRVAGSTDIVYEKTVQNHLDEASRKIVSDEIEDIEENSAKTAKQNKQIAKIKNALSRIFSPIINFIKAHMLIPIMVAGIVLAVLILIFLARKFRLLYRIRNRSRQHKSRGGYRSKAGRRMFARRQRQQRRMQTTEKSRRRNHSKHYQKAAAPKAKESKYRRNTNYSKRRKGTRESFGKNYFDF